MRLPAGWFIARSLIDHAAGLGVTALAALALSVPALAAPPANADPSLAPWFQSLRQPGTGTSCCSIADCRMTEYRTTRSGYEALVGKKWLPVPPDRVLQHTTNPTGRAIVCYLPGEGILCFVRPAES
jgi:hypothetical protein